MQCASSEFKSISWQTVSELAAPSRPPPARLLLHDEPPRLDGGEGDGDGDGGEGDCNLKKNYFFIHFLFVIF